ncbi:MAG: hypothetical protein CBC12_07580 [Candidatus Puniceispirillum sp. TMED52]|mgnify:FL=1|nr:MAG: hypothetical protein CBC12_07580 [Candidatus Puniceispirillum sp. TMED52]
MKLEQQRVEQERLPKKWEEWKRVVRLKIKELYGIEYKSSEFLKVVSQMSEGLLQVESKIEAGDIRSASAQLEAIKSYVPAELYTHDFIKNTIQEFEQQIQEFDEIDLELRDRPNEERVRILKRKLFECLTSLRSKAS